MPSGAIYRNTTTPKSAAPHVCPIYCDSDDNKLKMIPAGSGVTEVEVVDASSAQTLTNKTLTSPVVATPTITGAKQPVISGSGATVTLTAAQSGALCLFDRALGIVFTLPAAAAGLFFDFFTSVTITGGAAEVITAVGTVFMGGTIVMALEATTPGANPGPKFFTGNGTSHVKISSNGSTTGGILGSKYRVQCDGVNWFASGICLASGNIATPFA
jgi:hypothetical protein